jgi:hypothetical protein
MINFNTFITPSNKQEHLSSNIVHAKKLLFSAVFFYNFPTSIEMSCIEATHILASFILSATVYFLWFERNNRIFSSISHPHQEEVSADIIHLIRASLEQHQQAHYPRLHSPDMEHTGAVIFSPPRPLS